MFTGGAGADAAPGNWWSHDWSHGWFLFVPHSSDCLTDWLTDWLHSSLHAAPAARASSSPPSSHTGSLNAAISRVIYIPGLRISQNCSQLIGFVFLPSRFKMDKKKKASHKKWQAHSHWHNWCSFSALSLKGTTDYIKGYELKILIPPKDFFLWQKKIFVLQNQEEKWMGKNWKRNIFLNRNLRPCWGSFCLEKQVLTPLSGKSEGSPKWICPRRPQ